MANPNRRGLGHGLELLWGQVESPSRGPKPALTLDEIVRAAIEIADRGSLAALSMRQVAEQLGFTTMSLYRYVPNKDELLEVMRDVAVGEPPDPAPNSAWRVELSCWARAVLARYHEHPWMLEMEIRRPPFGPNHLRWLDAALHALAELGLSDADMLSVVLTLDSYVRGAATVQVGMARERRQLQSSEAELARVYAQIFDLIATGTRYPSLSKLVRAGVFAQPDASRDEFAFGLERTLDGIAVLVERGSVDD